MIIKVKGADVNMPIDQYAEVLETGVTGVSAYIKIKLLGTGAEIRIRPWSIIGVQLSDDLTLEFRYRCYETKTSSCV